MGFWQSLQKGQKYLNRAVEPKDSRTRGLRCRLSKSPSMGNKHVMKIVWRDATTKLSATIHQCQIYSFRTAAFMRFMAMVHDLSILLRHSWCAHYFQSALNLSSPDEHRDPDSHWERILCGKTVRTLIDLQSCSCYNPVRSRVNIYQTLHWLEWQYNCFC